MSSLPSSSLNSPISEIYPILGRFQQHVHHLEPGVEPQRFAEREVTLQSGIPDDLRQFLLNHNGAVLFDGDLCIRSINALSVAAANHPEVVCFAQMNVLHNPLALDSVRTELWAYIIDANGKGCYGIWADGHFTPFYNSFQDWLLSNVQLLVDGTFPSAFSKRRALTSHPIFFDATHVEGWMNNEDYGRASEVLGELLQVFPTPKSWINYATCLQKLERPGWENALLEAIRNLHFPLSYAGAVPDDRDWIFNIVDVVPVLRSSIEELLERLWLEEMSLLPEYLSIHDLYNLESVALLLCYTTTRPSFKFSDMMDQFSKWNAQFVPARLILKQIDVHTERDQHDVAETLIFGLMRRDHRFESECLLRLARIVVARHEPWGLHILFELLDAKPEAEVEIEAWLLATQYCLDNEHFEQGRSFLAKVEFQYDVEQQNAFSGWYWQCQAVLFHHEQRLGEAGRAFLKAKRQTPESEIVRMGLILSDEALLYQTLQEPQTANVRYESAMRHFSHVNASLRMAETLLSWARLSGSQQHFQQAATLFQQVGFASGLSVVEKHLSGRKNAWTWYLETTKELVQRWVQYRRAQGRGVRQEADNPERRIYGLKMAVSDSPIEIVDGLRTQVYAARTIIERDLVTPSHDQYAYFVAGIELLLAHPSIEAHDAILEFVRSTKMNTVAIEALTHCLARTRNVSVIESLQQLLTPQESVSTHWIATQVLGERRETTAIHSIVQLLDITEELVVQQSCLIALGRLGDDSVIPILDAYGDIPHLMEHWATALLLLGDDIAVHQLAGQLSEGKLGQQSILGHLVGRYGGTTNLLLLKRLGNSDLPVNLSAIHGLGYLGDSRALPILVEMTGLRDRNKATAASYALELITGHHENTEEYLLRARWQSWLEEHNKWVPNVRYRNGRPMSPFQLIEDLEHDDRLVRSSAYDELVITTGVHLAFDVDGSWRTQKAQIAAWKSWWKEHQSTYPIGRWVLHGTPYC